MTGKNKKSWSLYIDGAARGNPGKAGAGAYLLCNDKAVAKEGFFLGEKTNNQAEYLSLLVGLFFCKKHIKEDEHLSIYSDSQLLVRQLIGEYKVKNPGLIYLYNIVKSVLPEFSYSISHIVRDKNKHADALANKGIDDKISLPVGFKSFLKI